MLLPVGDEIPRRTFPYLNVALVLTNIVIFVAMAVRPDYPTLVHAYGFIPAQWTWTSLVTSMFLHGGLLHLAGNMLFLSVLGDNVEDRYGHVTYLFFYVFCGIAAAFAHLAFSPGADAHMPAIGASGAISGVLGAYFILFPFHQMKMLVFVIPVRVHAAVAIGLWIATQWLLVSAEREGRATGVAVWAHLGGFAFGAAVTLVLRLSRRLARPR